MYCCKIVKIKRLTCKIFQDKELGDVSASAGGFWLTDCAGTTGKMLLKTIVRLAGEIMCKRSEIRKTC
jgi:hypothetical protein